MIRSFRFHSVPAALAITCFWLVATFARAAAEPSATILILDGSGSMLERVAGKTKIESARTAVKQLVQSLPDGTPLGLVAYSHRRARACDDFEVLIAPAPLDRARFSAAVDGIKPQGNTPLAAALKFAADALGTPRGAANLVLVSDGVETCGGDPCAVALELKKKIPQLAIHVIAFDLSAKQAASFECVATATGGRFLPANDAASLADALVTIVQEAAAPTPPPAENLGAATVKPPASVAAGAQFQVEWTGPNNPGDYVTIVPAGSPDSHFANHSYTRSGSPLELTALIEPGTAEVRYLTARSRTVLARAPITITPVMITLDAPAGATAGSAVAVKWTGGTNRGDYLTIVPAGTPDAEYGSYAYAAPSGAVEVSAPMTAGAAEVRYVSGQGRQILARRPIAIAAAEVALDAEAEVTAGALVTVRWQGPNNRGDYVTIVTAGTPDNRYGAYSETRLGSPLSVTAPLEPGAAEIRYVSGQGARILGRRPITLVAATVALEADASAVAGAPVKVTWQGPNHRGDFLLIVKASATDNRVGAYTYTERGSPLTITTPIAPGAYEIRYVAGQGYRTLAARPLELTAPVIEIRAPANATVNEAVSFEWTGPNHQGDYFTIVPKATRDGTSLHYTYTRSGSPLKVNAPAAAGPAEIRYMSSQNNAVLARKEIEIRAAP